MISGFCGYGDSVGIPTGFSVGMGWVWALTFNPHGSPDYYVCKSSASADLWGPGLTSCCNSGKPPKCEAAVLTAYIFETLEMNLHEFW